MTAAGRLLHSGLGDAIGTNDEAVVIPVTLARRRTFGRWFDPVQPFAIEFRLVSTVE